MGNVPNQTYSTTMEDSEVSSSSSSSTHAQMHFDRSYIRNGNGYSKVNTNKKRKQLLMEEGQQSDANKKKKKKPMVKIHRIKSSESSDTLVTIDKPRKRTQSVHDFGHINYKKMNMDKIKQSPVDKFV